MNRGNEEINSEFGDEFISVHTIIKIVALFIGLPSLFLIIVSILLFPIT